MEIDAKIRGLGRYVSSVPGVGVISKCYLPLANAIGAMRVAGTPFPEGYFTVDTGHSNIPDFDVWITNNSIFNRRRLAGTYEAPVMNYLADQVDEDTIIWEVGAAAGYFSLAMAGAARKVVAFDEESMKDLKRSAEQNGFENIECVRGTVGKDIALDDFETPDIVLVDIEGWEYEALSNSPELLSGQPTLIVEIHEPGGAEHYYDGADPEGVRKSLEDAGYTIEEIHRRSKSNYNIVAEP